MVRVVELCSFYTDPDPFDPFSTKVLDPDLEVHNTSFTNK
jgi:hypothetical protein